MKKIWWFIINICRNSHFYLTEQKWKILSPEIMMNVDIEILDHYSVKLSALKYKLPPTSSNFTETGNRNNYVLSNWNPAFELKRMHTGESNFLTYVLKFRCHLIGRNPFSCDYTSRKGIKCSFYSEMFIE